MGKRNRPLSRKQQRGLDHLLQQAAKVRDTTTGGKTPKGDDNDDEQ